MKKFIKLLSLAILALPLAISSCSDKYDDSELRTSIEELRNRIEALETVQNALKNKLFINEVRTIHNGYEIDFSDGSTATIASYDGIPEPEECYIERIDISDEEVTFYLSDGTMFSIPIAGAISIEFECEENLVMIENQSRTIPYTIKTLAQDEIQIEVLSSSDIRAKVTPVDQMSGVIEINTTQRPDEFSKVVVIVSNGRRVIMRRLEFSDRGLAIFDNTEKECSSTSSEVELEFVSSEPFEVIIPADAQSWISYDPASRSAEKQNISLTLQPNNGNTRSADITVQSTESPMAVTFHITQYSEYKISESEAEAVYDIYKNVSELYVSIDKDTPLSDYPGLVLDPNTGHVVEIDFWGIFRYVGNLPKSIGQLKELRKLALYVDKMDAIPEEIAGLQKLEYLKLFSYFGNSVTVKLTGELPESLCRLTSLKYLELTNHGITSLPPSFAELKNLEEVILQFNELGSVEDLKILATLKNLKKLDLYSNKISGRIPSELYKLDKLEYLNLSINQLNGGLSEDIGNLKNLRELGLMMNSLSGNIPDIICTLTNLEGINLGDNNFSGSIPANIGNLKKLKALSLDSNGMTGEIPRSMTKLSNLESVSLLKNKFSGSIPPEIGTNNMNLRYFNLAFNEFSGSIPASYAHVEDLWLFNNKLTGKVPDEIMDAPFWRDRWGWIILDNDLDTEGLRFKGPVELVMYEDKAYTKPFKIQPEYAKHEITLLFQWRNDCPYLDDALALVKDAYSKYKDDGLEVIGRTYGECESGIKKYGMTWRTYFSQQLDYPYFVVPTITLIDKDENVIFTDVIHDRFSLPDVLRNYFGK